MIPGDRGKDGSGWLARPPRPAILIVGWGQHSPVPLVVFAHCQSREKELGGEER
jgi:hypothetical protein